MKQPLLAALAGLYHCYWHVKDEAGMEKTKADMLRLQSRSRAAKR